MPLQCFEKGDLHGRTSRPGKKIICYISIYSELKLHQGNNKIKCKRESKKLWNHIKILMLIST